MYWTDLPLHKGVELAEHVEEALLLVPVARQVDADVAVDEGPPARLVRARGGEAQNGAEAGACGGVVSWGVGV